MKKRIRNLFIIILICCIQITSWHRVNACDENKCNEYLKAILFGDNASKYSGQDNVKLLFDALYICSIQTDMQGQERLNNLNSSGIKGTNSIEKINIWNAKLVDCSHKKWSYICTSKKEVQQTRKDILENTVDKVFNFGFFESEKKEAFTRLIYYLHILSDYLNECYNCSEIKDKGKKIPSFSGSASVVLNGNKPYFNIDDYQNGTYITYSQLDSLGRAGMAIGRIGPEILPPSNSRQNIGYIKPSGWQTIKYPDIIKDNYLFNRCHLIAHELAGEDAERNLITGTRYLNADLMLKYENQIRKYIDDTGNHVIYRVTPIYEGENLLAAGVRMEAYSCEDFGQGICFNVFCYNIQPGININYSDGSNRIANMIGNNKKIPFAANMVNDDKPDLIYEISKCFEEVFDKQMDSQTYKTMTSRIQGIANDARNVYRKINSGKIEDNKMNYFDYVECIYKYYDILKNALPKLLSEETFYNKVFK